jgi:hypothetical protein
MMSSNSDRIIHQLHCDFKELIEYVTGDREGDESAPQASSPPSPRPTPANKEVWATLESKDIAFERLAQRVAQRVMVGFDSE